jgi:plastocyanin
MRIALALAALLAAVALVGASCGGDDGEASDTTTETTTDTTTDNTTDTSEPSQASSALKGSVGPGFTISLVTDDDAAITSLPSGSYELEVEDLSSAHNFHLSGPGVDVMTEVGEEENESFTVDLQPGTYTFVCDPHSASMHGSFQVT